MRLTGNNAKTMRGLISTLAGLVFIAAAVPALAQSATKIGEHANWGTYSYQAQNGKVCYVLTIPTDKQPPNVDHGDPLVHRLSIRGQSVPRCRHANLGSPPSAGQ